VVWLWEHLSVKHRLQFDGKAGPTLGQKYQDFDFVYNINYYL